MHNEEQGRPAESGRPAPPLRDQYGRSISYLRLSVTDRCNLRCLYCAPSGRPGEDVFKDIRHGDILRYEELLRLARIAAGFGVLKIRLTGGEPFVRSGFMDFFRILREALPDIFLGITTNATLVRPHLKALKDLRLDSLNISLDSLKADRFERITGGDFLPEVLKAVHGALESGLRVKINAVGLKEINRDELPDFLEFARRYPVDFRVIEHMPLGGVYDWKAENFWPAERILSEAGELAELLPEKIADKNILRVTPDDSFIKFGGSGACGVSIAGPAKMYEISGGKGRFGVISPVSDHFCLGCNRLRITSDGRLRPCLFSDSEYPLRPLLRQGGSDEDIYRVFTSASSDKPIGSVLLSRRAERNAAIKRIMSSIGG